MTLEHRPPHVRKKIVFLSTVGVGVVLVALLVVVYSTKEAKGTPEAGSRLRNFYNTILGTGQSYIDNN